MPGAAQCASRVAAGAVGACLYAVMATPRATTDACLVEDAHSEAVELEGAVRSCAPVAARVRRQVLRCPVAVPAGHWASCLPRAATFSGALEY